MFPFFNRDFFKSMLSDQRELEIKSPNGGIYRFSTNAIDEKTFNEYRKKLEEAVRNNDQAAFDKAWKELTSKNELRPNIEAEFKKFYDDVQKLFQSTVPFFNKSVFPSISEPFFSEPKALTEESIDKQIEHYEQKIEELKRKKSHIDVEKRKLQIREEINKKKNLLDMKLDEFAKNLDNDEMKKKLTEEMTEINNEIKQLEKELEKLS